MLFPGPVFVIQSLSHVLSLWNHGLQHTTLPCPHYLPEFGQTHVHWVNNVIQPSHPLSPSSPPALNLSQHQSLPMIWLFSSGGQSIGASVSVLPMNIWDWFPLGLTGLISWMFKTQEPCPAPQLETISSSVLSLIYGPTLTSVHDYWKNYSFDYTDFVSKVMSLLFRFSMAFLPRSKCLLILWLQSLSAVILEPKKI